ncbi:MAG: c-type cytochrome [Pseudomonadales bacterium]|nr:c-type cytochrome [Pseudomonadales bacterium]
MKHSIRTFEMALAFSAMFLFPAVANAMEPPTDYLQYCSSCHGKGGKGDGPLAANMKTKPADLTTISHYYDGKFPTQKMRQTISGAATDRTNTQFHGPVDMPVWGKVFRDQSGDSIAEARIDLLVEYIESIQK